MIHHLKIMPEYFQAVIDRKKPMEIRRNDRGFKPGDRCIFEEYAGSVSFPACPKWGICPPIEIDGSGEEYFDIPSECTRSMCGSYTKEQYTGRRCLIKIKDVFDLTSAGLDGYVAFTFDILNVIDKR